ncbi:hypothetical protein BDQ12DRAFT_733513 [Crucibulum laeve]|uniref:rRNA biogenesis protein RRP36 n=1 Tax=Crucibulum laeve TaxID=68775 RepID=A0A5C3M785_9AGAR|nr:hypothetical protein BDQ12DRAFT_733513 [Crucibulum laeve]
MPRRPRPASRQPFKEQEVSNSQQQHKKTTLKRKSAVDYFDEDEPSEDEEDDAAEFEQGSSGDSDVQANMDSAGEEDGDEYDQDADASRVAQWVDEDDLELEMEEENPNKAPARLKDLQSDLSGLPLGALRRAQHAVIQAEGMSDSESDSDEDSESGSESEGQSSKGKEKQKEKVDWSAKRRTDIAKRSSKHAPTEVTSKKPVTRRRTVVEVKKVEPRDPRFLPTAGEFSTDKFQKQYSFLADAHTTELSTLRENLKRARKQLAASPRDLLYERQQEVNRLEFAVKRAESLVNKDRRDKVEREALSKVTKEEKNKRKQGKGGWWMKEADKRELLVRARYDALAADGGKRAVKKAIEKKQKKMNQKEKKSRPYPKGGFGEGRTPDAGYGNKRRRVE